jgi:hypothetical protein
MYSSQRKSSMNYLRAYVRLCKTAKSRNNFKKKYDKSLYEKHHIFPESVYGRNSYTVLLTFREHYIAHKLLWKAFKFRYGEHHHKTRKMASAYHFMVYGKGDTHRNLEIYTSRVYSSARKAIRECKLGRKRVDMVGKSYFGASEETIKLGIEKMRKKKTGIKIAYPKNRKSSPCSDEKANKISVARKNTVEKYKRMTTEQFINWIQTQKLYTKSGRKNSNVTRAIISRGEQLENYYV